MNVAERRSTPYDRRQPSGTDETGHNVTQGQFFERIGQLEDRMQDYHRRSREHVDEKIDKVLEAFRAHEDVDREVADRVLTIETERGIEKTNASKHGAIAGSLGAGLTMGLVEGVKRLWGGHS